MLRCKLFHWKLVPLLVSSINYISTTFVRGSIILISFEIEIQILLLVAITITIVDIKAFIKLNFKKAVVKTWPRAENSCIFVGQSPEQCIITIVCFFLDLIIWVKMDINCIAALQHCIYIQCSIDTYIQTRETCQNLQRSDVCLFKTAVIYWWLFVSSYICV